MSLGRLLHRKMSACRRFELVNQGPSVMTGAKKLKLETFAWFSTKILSDFCVCREEEEGLGSELSLELESGIEL